MNYSPFRQAQGNRDALNPLPPAEELQREAEAEGELELRGLLLGVALGAGFAALVIWAVAR